MKIKLVSCTLLWVAMFFCNLSYGQNGEGYSLSGQITDTESGQPLPGALIRIKELDRFKVADESGNYSLILPGGTYQISVDFLGFEIHQSTITLLQDQVLDFSLSPVEISMEGVEVLATGYQEIPKERATGSFVQLDRELVNRRVSTNLIDRLEDVTSGLVFNRAGPADDQISIRGRSTLFANTQPLYIIDNFPYDGPLENINPNDVETVTVLRDAAAASIWGARAGNGVIVITTKNGKENTPQFSFNSNVTISQQPNLFYQPAMGISDFIDVEMILFDRGYYSGQENSVNKTPLSPVVEALIAGRDGLITPQQLDGMISDYRGRDVRNDLLQYYYRRPVNQQYSLNLSGGSEKYRYYVSGGFDENSENISGNHNNRITLSMRNQWRLASERLELGLGLYYSGRNSKVTTELPGNTYPYDRLTGDGGEPLSIIQQYSQRYIASIGEEEYLKDWNYIPLHEIGELDRQSRQDDYRLNISLGYKILNGLKAEASYQFWKNYSEGRNYSSETLFFTRDLINQFTQINEDGSIAMAVPEGGILDLDNGKSYSHNLRFQLNYSKVWQENHELTALAGYELRDRQSTGDAVRYYGYDDELGISKPVDQVSRFALYHNNRLASISNENSHTGTVDRFLSYFFNAGYSYRKKYHASVSARKDASNLFGVETNQRGVPLWSAGLGWTLSEESFYRSGFLPYAKIRISYGYNGNMDNTLSSQTTAQYYTNYSHVIPAGELGGVISSTSNPKLRWEKIGVLNVGVDLESRGGRIRATLEGYIKNGQDLIGDAPFPPSTGIVQFRGNTANTLTRGMDLDIHTINITGKFNWQTNFLFSYIKEEVKAYFYKGSVVNYLSQAPGQLVPLEGKPLFAIYSLPWAGLDPATGDPQGYLEGEPSKDYSAIFNSASPETLQYHGPRRPSSFGSLRNTLSWNGFSLSANLAFRLGYYYRRESVLYASILQGRGGHSDYSLRWQKPSDELITHVPSLPTTSNTLRENTYRYSDVLVEKGDHIRLQDIRLSYTFRRVRMPSFPFRQAELYGYANNLGILWKASSDPIDPDFRTAKPPVGISFGLRVDL